MDKINNIVSPLESLFGAFHPTIFRKNKKIISPYISPLEEKKNIFQ